MDKVGDRCHTAHLLAREAVVGKGIAHSFRSKLMCIAQKQCVGVCVFLGRFPGSPSVSLIRTCAQFRHCALKRGALVSHQVHRDSQRVMEDRGGLQERPWSRCLHWDGRWSGTPASRASVFAVSVSLTSRLCCLGAFQPSACLKCNPHPPTYKNTVLLLSPHRGQKINSKSRFPPPKFFSRSIYPSQGFY